MGIDQDESKVALKAFHDEGIYVVDKDRLTIYYIGRDSDILESRGATRETAESVAKYLPIARIPGSESPPVITSFLQTLGITPETREDLDACLHPRSQACGHSQVVATIVPVKNQKGEIVGAMQVFEDRDELSVIKRRLEELERMVLLDPLTGVGNRRYAEIHLQSCLDELRRYGWPFGVLFIDVDDFKSINDRFGHVIGDAVLQITAQTLVSCVRSSDLVCRWGGDEFVVVLKNISMAQIGRIAEKIRSIVAELRIPTEGEPLEITISVGAALGRLDDSTALLVDRADRLMYESKESGRNCVTIEQALI